MTLHSVRASVTFDAVDIDFQQQVFGLIDKLYASVTGRNLLESAAGLGVLSFAKTADSSAFTSSTQTIELNLNQAAGFGWFNDKGSYVSSTTVLILAHELKHAVTPGNAPDPGPGGNSLPSNGEVNSGSWITDGQAVIAQNSVARQLGRPDEVRVSYHGYGGSDPSTIFVVGRNYTEGAVIDSVRIATRENSGGGANMDESAHSTDLRNLLFGSGSADTISAAAGNDWVYGLGGDDIIRGGTGYDVIYGDDKFDYTITGNDTLYGDAGNDRLYGGKGVDHLYGGVGIDTLVGGEGADFLFGDDGNDIIYGDFGINNPEPAEEDNGADEIHGGKGNDNVDAQGGDDLVMGDDGDDTISGGKGDDVLNGGKGKDVISGDKGNDSLVGGDGDDILYSGEDDTGEDDGNGLFGEAGNDRLIFDGGGGSADGGKGDDRIEIADRGAAVRIDYSKGEGVDTIVGSTSPDVTLDFNNMSTSQLKLEFRYTSVTYTFLPGNEGTQYYDTATYRGDFFLMSKSDATSALMIEDTTMIFQRYPYYQAYLHPGLQTITYTDAPVIATTSGAIVFGLDVGTPDIEVQFINGWSAAFMPLSGLMAAFSDAYHLPSADYLFA